MGELYSFGAWVRRRRRALDLTQEELAQRVSCSIVTIRRIEADERRPSRQLAARLADYLEIPQEERAAFIKVARAERAVDRITGLDRPQQMSPVDTLEHHRHSLPAQTTPLIGREVEVRAVCDLLHRTDTRLVTITGPGGVGKTRLALAVAAHRPDDFAHGVCVVNLAPIDDASLVPPTVAKTLEIQEQDGRPLAKTLLAYLQNRQLLLVLDNFEQVLPAAVQVADWLAACPQLTVLVTSRAVLRVYGEHEYPVQPLAVPGTGSTGDGKPAGQSALDIAQYPAVALFVERARAVKPDFALTEEKALITAEICRRLDGLPLAIELAAARTKVLSVQQIATRLDTVFQLLTQGPQTAAPRHQTLHAAIDWSYALLSESERALLRRLSVFAGGFTLEAAEHVCTEHSLNAIHILDILADLVDKSLVQVQDREAETRYHLLETIRQYAAEKLQEAGEADIRERHVVFFVELAVAAEQWLMTIEREAWLRRLEAEHDNIRAALRWSLAAQPARCLRFASALLWFWWFRGYWTEGRAWLEQALTKTAGISSLEDRAKGHFGAGLLAWFQSDYAGAHPHLLESEAIYRALGEERGLAQALIYNGGTLYGQGAFPQARAKLEEALTIALRLEDQWLIALARLGLGDVVTAQGEPLLGREMLEASLQLWRQFGDERMTAYALMYLGQALLALGDYPNAESHLAESLAIHQRGRQKSGVAISLLGLADIAIGQEAYDRAALYCRDALKEFAALDAKQGMAESLERIAGLAVTMGKPLLASQLFGAIDMLRKAIGAPRTPVRQTMYAQAVMKASNALGEKGFLSAWSQGQAMSLPQVLEHGLGSLPPATEV